MDTELSARPRRRWGCLVWLGLGGSLLVLPALLIASFKGLWSAAALPCAFMLAAVSLLLWHHRRRFARFALVTAVLVLVVPPLGRVLLVHNSEQVQLVRISRALRPGDDARLLSRSFPEPDGALMAATALGFLGGVGDVDAARFPAIMAEAYARTDPPASQVPTPAIATYLGLQRPRDFDLLVLSPLPASNAPEAALIFLHGFSGNFYVYCWEVAQAARAVNLVTLCPSSDALGAWWTRSGDETLNAVLSYARGLGVKRFYLAGLSNGAAGASVLALAHQEELAGLVLISGMRAERPPELPVLVLQGDSDRMMPAEYARAYAAESARVSYHEVPGGHFVFFTQHQRLRSILAEFLRSSEAKQVGSENVP